MSLPVVLGQESGHSEVKELVGSDSVIAHLGMGLILGNNQKLFGVKSAKLGNLSISTKSGIVIHYKFIHSESILYGSLGAEVICEANSRKGISGMVQKFLLVSS